jgi:hypothetical protein
MLSHVGALESAAVRLTLLLGFNASVLTLEISHVCPDVRVQSVNNHLAVCRPSDFYSAVHQTRSWRCSSPCVILTDVLGLGEEVEKVTLVELSLANHSSLQELLPAVVECAVEESKKYSSILAKNVTVGVVQFAEDVNLAKNGVGAGCHYDLYRFMVVLCMQLCEYTQCTGSEECDDVCVRRELGSRVI